MEVSSAFNGRTSSDLVFRRFGSKKIYASQNQRGNRVNSDTEESLIAKFGNALRTFLHVKDAQIQFSDCASLPAKDSQLQDALSAEFNLDIQLQSSDRTSLPGKDAKLQDALSTEFNVDHPKLLTTPPTGQVSNKQASSTEFNLDHPKLLTTSPTEQVLNKQDALPAEFNLDHPELLTTPPSEEELNKYGHVLCAENTPLMILSENAPSMGVSEEDEVSDSLSLFPIEEHSESLICEQPASLPVALAPRKELISVMKGTREKLGIMPLTKLTVTWSPDVYDPPVTSVTHTVTGHHHHHRSRNKKTSTSSKKHKGGKSSHGSSSSGSKRHSKHSSKSDHHHRSKSSSSSSPSSSSPTERSSVFGDYKSTLDLVDYESTCGNSFLGKLVAEVLAPVAEAN